MSNPVGCWAPRKTRPKLKLQRMRQYSYAYAALCPATGDMSSLILPESNNECMQIFMTEFAIHRNGQATAVIMDQAPWHRSGKIKIPESMTIEFHPPYSPELNPVEQLWKHVRTNYMDNHYWDDLDKMELSLCDALRECSNNRETIKSFSLSDWMVYQ